MLVIPVTPKEEGVTSVAQLASRTSGTIALVMVNEFVVALKPKA
jgi:hypothetical protein